MWNICISTNPNDYKSLTLHVTSLKRYKTEEVQKLNPRLNTYKPKSSKGFTISKYTTHYKTKMTKDGFLDLQIMRSKEKKIDKPPPPSHWPNQCPESRLERNLHQNIVVSITYVHLPNRGAPWPSLKVIWLN